MFLGEFPIFWHYKKQNRVFLSSMEAECRTMTTTTMKIVAPSKSYCDNKSAIYITCNHMFHKKIKHIKMDYHHVIEEFMHKIMNYLLHHWYIK